MLPGCGGEENFKLKSNIFIPNLFFLVQSSCYWMNKRLTKRDNKLSLHPWKLEGELLSIDG